MKYRYLILAAALVTLGLSCSGPVWINFTAPLEGTLSVVFVNETPFKVSTYWGAYNPLDVQHGMVVNSLELEGGQNSQVPVTVVTTRNLDVAGPTLRQMAELGQVANIDPADIPDDSSFTDNTSAVVGTAPAAQFTLGNDYAGGDFLEIHFIQVPGTTNQFAVQMKATSPSPTPTPALLGP